MAAGAWTATNATRTNILAGTTASGDTYKMALLLSTSNMAATSTTYALLTNEVAGALGYTTGGVSVAITLSGTTTVTAVMTTAPVWTAAAGAIVAKWAVIYEVGGNILCYATLDSGGANVTATDGNTLTVGTNGATIFTLA